MLQQDWMSKIQMSGQKVCHAFRALLISWRPYVFRLMRLMVHRSSRCPCGVHEDIGT